MDFHNHRPPTSGREKWSAVNENSVTPTSAGFVFLSRTIRNSIDARGSSPWKNAKEKRDRDRRRGRVSGMAETRRRSTGRREIVNYVRGWMVDRWPIVRIYGVETSDLRSSVRDKGTILAPTHETTVGPSTKTASLEDPLLSPVSRSPKTLRRRLSLPRRSAPLDRRRVDRHVSRSREIIHLSPKRKRKPIVSRPCVHSVYFPTLHSDFRLIKRNRKSSHRSYEHLVTIAIIL